VHQGRAVVLGADYQKFFASFFQKRRPSYFKSSTKPPHEFG